MPDSFEKSVKGGTKIKASILSYKARLAPPKAKYVEHILIATHTGDAGVAEIFRALQNRLRDSTWTIVFKALIIVHLMIREGEPNVTLKYLADSPSKLAISNFSDVQIQGTNIRHYYNYVLARAKAFRDTRIDWVREGQGRLKRQSVDKGLLRETESVQNQIANLLRCDLLSTEAENEITICAFRLLTMDLLALYHVMNEGTINVLEHYFEMSKFDAERALAIYKTFTKQTNLVVEYLSTARHFENSTRLEIPKLKHAPTSLTASLEEYLNDPQFEENRRQYLSQQDGRKGRKASAIDRAADTLSGFKSAPVNKGSSNTGTGFESKPVQDAAPSKLPVPKSPAPDLIDFFDSIEQNQQTMATQPPQQAPQYQTGPQLQQQQHIPQQTVFAPQQAQPTGFAQQQPMQSSFTIQPTGFAPGQLVPVQNGQQPQPEPQTNGFSGNTNPFGQPQTQQPAQTNFSGAGFGGYTQQPQSQQPDLFSNMPPNNGNSFPSQHQSFNPGQQFFGPTQQATNTGQQSSNPFRQSMFPQATGASTPSFANNTPPTSTPLSPQSTNPFARTMTGPTTSQSQGSPFTSPPPNIPQGTPFNSPPPPIPQSQPVQQLTPQRTGTNPFARPAPTGQPNQVAAPLVASPTGSTNPFRQSMFHNQQTGQGWQSGQGTMGGFEQLETVPIFPRPGQPNESHQQPQQQANFFS